MHDVCVRLYIIDRPHREPYVPKGEEHIRSCKKLLLISKRSYRPYVCAVGSIPILLNPI